MKNRKLRQTGRTTQKTTQSRPVSIARREPLSLADSPLILGSLLCVMIALAYIPLLPADFVWDDEIFIESEVVQSWSGIAKIWFDPRKIKNEAHYWPITYTSFWLQHKLWGDNATGFHVVSICMHMLATLLAWRVLARLAVPGAWFAAAIFAVHPVHAEVVSWSIAQKDLLAAIFYFSAARAWIRFDAGTNGTRAWADYAIALICYVAAIFSKTTAVTLPAVFVIFLWWRHGRLVMDDLKRLSPFFGIGIIYAIADTAFYSSREKVEFGYSFAERIINASKAIWHYLIKLVAPIDVGAIYPHWSLDASDARNWIAVGAAALIPVAMLILHRWFGRSPAALAAYFVVCLAPVLGFIDFGFMQFSYVADRYQYLAMLAPTVLVVAAVSRVAVRLPELSRQALMVTCLIPIIGLSVITWQQTYLYQSKLRLFQYFAEIHPTARGANIGIAVLSFEQGDYETAWRAAVDYIEQDPDGWEQYSVAGSALMELGDIERAQPFLETALSRKPGESGTLERLGAIANRQGRFGDALAYLEAIESEDVPNPMLFEQKIQALRGLERYDDARSLITEALALYDDPGLQSHFLSVLAEVEK